MTEHDEYLRHLTFKGAEERLDPDERETWEERLNHELDIIEKAGFPSYFLIVWDLIAHCRSIGIPVGPGRGSVCGSLVTYCLYITDVDPIKWDIPFERFLHLERIAMPDIDLDLCKRRREEVVTYVKDTYGEESVAQIVTHGTIQAKGAIRRAYKDLEVESTITGRFNTKMAEEAATLIPEGSGADQIKLQEWMDRPEDADDYDPKAIVFKELMKSVGARYAKACKHKVSESFVLETILYLEGRRAHGSVHSAGLVIGSKGLQKLQIPLGKRNKTADPHCEWDMDGAEKTGLLKLDVLGLRTMTLIGDIEDMVRRDKDPDFRIKDMPLDDAPTYKLLGGGPRQLKGVFQLSKDQIGNAMKGIHPSEFEDVITILALYRPGPMEQLGTYAKRKSGVEDVEYAHDDLIPALDRTYGIIIYQEQVMAIARIMAGYNPGEADIFRKAIGKKIPELIRKEIANFTKKAIAKGYDPKIIEELGRQVAYFGRYGFNRGHATGYAFITYWTAYLKCHYPTEFFAAVLTSYVDKTDQIALYGSDARSFEVGLLTPSIHTSDSRFRTEDDVVRWGLAGIKGLGESAVIDIVDERSNPTKFVYTRDRVEKQRVVEGGDKLETYMANVQDKERLPHKPRPFKDFADLCARLTHIPINAKKALIAAGCFDDGDLEFRAKLYEMAPEINKQAKKKKPKPVEEPDEWMNEMEMLALERDTLGSFVTKHPLEPHQHLLDMWDVPSGGLFTDLLVDARIKLAGVVMSIRDHVDTKGNRMAWLTLEANWIGIPEVIVFASTWKGVSVKEGDVVIIKAKKTEHHRFGVGLQAEDVMVMDPLRMRAKSILLMHPDIDHIDIHRLFKYTSNRGAKVSILTDVGNGRLALIRTKSFIQTTVHTLNQLQSDGWQIRLDPTRVNMFGDESIEKLNSTHQGRGAERLDIWELPMARAIVGKLDGKVIAEYRLSNGKYKDPLPSVSI